MRFASLSPSPIQSKKYRITFEPYKVYDFGSKNSSTYLDHKDAKKRDAYIARHAVNEDWNKVNPGSLSRYILWGDSTNIKHNLIDYLNKFNIQY